MKICFLGGLGISLPFIFYFIGGFVIPGLSTREKSVLFPGCVVAFILFLAGAAMTYFVILPFSLAFTIEFTFDVLGLDTYRPEAGNYYSTVIWMTFAVGLAFEFPLIIVLLTWIGVLSVEKLRSNRRMVFVILMVSAALITPGGDPVSLCILTIPLYLLYELSILSGSFIERRRKKKEWEEWDEDIDGPRPDKPGTGMGLNKKFIAVVVLVAGTLAWIAVNKQEQLSDFIDAARNFGSFGGREEGNGKTKDNLPKNLDAQQPITEMGGTSAANGENINLKIGSTLQLRLRHPLQIDLSRSEANGTLLFEAQVIGIYPAEKTLSESNESK
jgi:Tat protein translocase TatC